MDIPKLFRAYYECRRHKRNTRSATLFEMHYERELFHLADEVESRTYSPSPSVAFIVDYPVKREILAPAFRDRVIHHYLIAQLEEGFEKLFIHDSYAYRK